VVGELAVLEELAVFGELAALFGELCSAVLLLAQAASVDRTAHIIRVLARLFTRILYLSY
jgi:hypothetical protein